MTCEYCTPNKQGHIKSLAVDKHYLKNHSNFRHKRNTLKINRHKNKKKNYFLGYHSKDYINKDVLVRNNGFLFKVNINYCPMCGRDLKEVLKND